MLTVLYPLTVLNFYLYIHLLAICVHLCAFVLFSGRPNSAGDVGGAALAKDLAFVLRPF